VNQRIFQQMTVPQIIAQVLEEHGILASEHKFQLSAVFPERIYCVQYDESDLHFVQRLCEEEGIPLGHRFGILKIALGGMGYHLGYQNAWHSKILHIPG
jgi:uncharacterized protein involved in type VI secretion and phage assembly